MKESNQASKLTHPRCTLNSRDKSTLATQIKRPSFHQPLNDPPVGSNVSEQQIGWLLRSLNGLSQHSLYIGLSHTNTQT
ncbi:hypothetical protein QJS04_geneDACA006812 [Acorus gramineus]|uniref:Uncharacterized protein n=1 Tax=Acorus gramineus TaxID=55184 RepID=A0AAV9AXU4_ACOGR|nr:hypothetical protein QJS04_geneDACA006812 [Acorus gramineus]